MSEIETTNKSLIGQGRAEYESSVKLSVRNREEFVIVSISHLQSMVALLTIDEAKAFSHMLKAEISKAESSQCVDV